MPSMSFAKVQPQAAVIAPVEAPAAPVADPAPPPAVAAPKKARKPKVEAPVDVPVVQQEQEPPMDPQMAEFLAWKRAQASGQVAPGGGLVEEAPALAQVPAGVTRVEPPPAAPVEAPVAPTRALATYQAPGAPAKFDTPFQGGDRQIDTNDLTVQKLHIVQQIGELARSFRPGEIVLDRRVSLYRPLAQGEPPQPCNAPVEFFVLGFQDKLWVERTTGGGGRVARSQEEVLQLGGALTYADAETNDKPWFQTMSRAIVLVKKPEHLDPDDFCFEAPDGSYWALAQWAMKGGAYTHGARPIYTARRMGVLRKSWVARCWRLQTKFQAYPNGHSAFIPLLAIGAAPTPEFVAWLSDTLSGRDMDEEAAAGGE